MARGSAEPLVTWKLWHSWPVYVVHGPYGNMYLSSQYCPNLSVANVRFLIGCPENRGHNSVHSRAVDICQRRKIRRLYPLLREDCSCGDRHGKWPVSLIVSRVLDFCIKMILVFVSGCPVSWHLPHGSRRGWSGRRSWWGCWVNTTYAKRLGLWCLGESILS